ncbi:MAG: hypothetical protein A2X61_08270 [Ignavibacteria bacterium GWB2_35_12]|nr:MAG: hypothetical protein A2X61_08270 [Ignavibacteria bacterium GWB2_35_12]OGU92699.1 MAG: hypothetical protein A2220_03830 [Ignavibacteria bacterium RIFOXYA2_FULL_35_10]OGV22451.1 MAG: hypothetical protein A2475_15625 [Ignavibacteria bacterium RIFOXYC2_FULL_35_21]
MSFRIIFILTFLILSISSSYSQSDNSEKHNDIKISFGYRQSLVMFNNAGQFNVCLEYFVSDNISLDYSLAGNFSSYKTFIHAPLGLVGGLSLLSESLKSDYSTYDYLILLLMMIPEGVNYYIPMNEKMNMVPYIHPLGYDYVIDDYSVTGSVGMKFEIEPFDNISLNPFAGIKIFYKHQSATFGFDIGLLFGIKF